MLRCIKIHVIMVCGKHENLDITKAETDINLTQSVNHLNHRRSTCQDYVQTHKSSGLSFFHCSIRVLFTYLFISHCLFKLNYLEDDYLIYETSEGLVFIRGGGGKEGDIFCSCVRDAPPTILAGVQEIWPLALRRGVPVFWGHDPESYLTVQPTSWVWRHLKKTKSNMERGK